MHSINAAITIAALIVAASLVIFLYNMITSLRKGEKAPSNPWRATTLEWQTPDTPPHHGNWGPKLPVVYRWAYDYSVPGATEDFIPQNEPVDPKLARRHGTTVSIGEQHRHRHGAARRRRGLVLRGQPADGKVMGKPASEEGDVGAIRDGARAHRPVDFHGGRHVAVQPVPVRLLDAHARTASAGAT